jgi:hypothetical protein
VSSFIRLHTDIGIQNRPTIDEYGTTVGVDCDFHENQLLNLEKKEK